MVRIHLKNRKRRSTSKRPTHYAVHSARLSIEQLEDRRVMAGFIQGFAFIDAGVPNNHFDAGELPKVGATIELRSADGSALLQSVMTGADGYYRFDGLTTGTYQVKEIPISGYTNQGVEFSTVLSSASPLNAGTILVNLVDPDSAPSVTINRQPELAGASVSYTLVGGPLNSFTQPSDHVQQFQININGGSDFYSFCTDLFHAFTDGNAVSFQAQPGTLPLPPGLAANIGRIGYLYNTFGTDLLAAPTDRAGLQIAIWELIYDASPDLNSGAFTVGPGPSNAAAIAAANSYLAISAGQDQRAIFLNDLAPPFPNPAGLGNQGMLA
ncbi:MAG: SdrD B-like domain-containing protein, partial [Planctomycetota bacterium]|nr:SdrD B-like domain-containing protein [Planctomycetota bacterium]